METKTYDGWTNYETWCVNLWMGNEEGAHRYWRAAAQTEWDGAAATKIFSREEAARIALEDRLKAEHEEARPDLGASVWADMLGAAFDEVNWREIAEGLLENVDKAEEVEEDEEAEA